ncbi:MAG: class I SAM-dependent methyltransferase [Phycisphaerales bacterium]|nr:MAG: class I SAM-dependent methyltransferase [Phycisphaerales bacterium]
MTPSSTWPFQSPLAHEAASAVIRDRSTNRQDIREASLQGLNLASARDVLDLGCGFGFMAETLAMRVAEDAKVVGVDVWPDNEEAFRERIAPSGRQGEFRCLSVDSTLPWPDRSFDLVVCSYSLYFFPKVIPDIARILREKGVLLAITHSERSVEGQLPAAGLADAACELVTLARQFSAENGREKLAGSFGTIRRIDYHNSLRFRPEHREDLYAYLRFKLPLLIPNAKPGDELPDELTGFIKRLLASRGEVVIGKDDAIFQCRDPLCH